MKNLLLFELRKLLKQKSFYICTIIIIAIIAISINATTSSLNKEYWPSLEIVILEAINSSNFTLISSIFLTLFICADYDQTTVKNIYSHGFSRNKVYFSKLIVSAIAITVMFLFTILFTLLFGLMCTMPFHLNSNSLVFLFGQLLYCFAYGIFVCMISFVFKKLSFAIPFSIISPLIINLVLVLIDLYLENDSFKLYNYWFDSFIKDLSNFQTNIDRIMICIVFSVIYGLIFATVGGFINQKHEL